MTVPQQFPHIDGGAVGNGAGTAHLKQFPDSSSTILTIRQGTVRELSDTSPTVLPHLRGACGELHGNCASETVLGQFLHSSVRLERELFGNCPGTPPAREQFLNISLAINANVANTCNNPLRGFPRQAPLCLNILQRLARCFFYYINVICLRDTQLRCVLFVSVMF